jgi:hypothetical protein
MQLSAQQADRVLFLQLLVAWAGEGRTTPPRLGWWSTDLVDEDGGLDLLNRLAPRTAAWASLALCREAARRVDQTSRRKLADPDTAMTLFSLGFAVDEQLDDRLAALRREGTAPWDALLGLTAIRAEFSTEAFTQALTLPAQRPGLEIEPGGRRLRGQAPENRAQAAELLTQALLPSRGDAWSPAWPMPYFRV